MKNVMKALCIVFLSIGVISCGKDDANNNDQEQDARVSVRLIDEPGDYDAVFVDVQDVVVKYNGSDDEVTIGEINAGIYDLLELTGGVSVLLVDDEIPAGNISQIRLILGSENTIVVDGETLPLSTPSAEQSGLKIQVNQTLEAGIFYEFILDFDVDSSIVEQGNGGYKLNPVIRASTVAETGSIGGIVLPVGIQSMVTATSGSTEISAFANAAGEFVLSGVPAGTYTLTYEADVALNLPPIVVENVQVSVGSMTTVDTVQF